MQMQYAKKNSKCQPVILIQRDSHASLGLVLPLHQTCSCNHSAGGSEDPQLVLHNMTLIVLKDASEWNGK